MAKTRESLGLRAGEFTQLLEAFHQVCDVKSPVMEYRLTHVSEKKLVCKTARAVLSLELDLGVERPFSIETDTLYNVISNFSADQEISFGQQEDVLTWQCGSAKGRMATSAIKSNALKELEALPKMPKNATEVWYKLAELLNKGVVSCSNSALASVGLHGVVLTAQDDHIHCMSSDDVTISIAREPKHGKLFETPVTIQPLEAKLLEVLCRDMEGEIAIIPDKFILFRGHLPVKAGEEPKNILTAYIALVPPLKYDLWEVSKPFMPLDPNVTSHFLPREQINAFVRRATNMAETRQRVRVTIVASSGQVLLKFQETTAQQDEYFLADDLKLDGEMEISVDALKLSKALNRCNEMILDYMVRKCLVFRSEDKSFFYVIAGQAET